MEKESVNDKLIYPELSYKVVGIAFNVGKEVGFGHKESFYQKALAKALSDEKINFIEQLPAQLIFREKPIGIYYFDFLVENKIVIELKTRNYFSKKDIEQLYRYLKAKDLKLGIIIHFTNEGVKFKRVVNIL